MNFTDPIADMLTRIRNAVMAGHAQVAMPNSKIKVEIARILKDEGYILNYKLVEEGAAKIIRIYLKYTPANQPVISRIERVSRPGCRIYVGGQEVPRVLGGLGDDDLMLAILAPESVMVDALVDGGDGFDRARVTGNVAVTNVEEVESI